MEYVIWYFRDMKLGHILGTRDFELTFWGSEICSCDIEKEDAVQHPQIRLCITFELLEGTV